MLDLNIPITSSLWLAMISLLDSLCVFIIVMYIDEHYFKTKNILGILFWALMWVLLFGISVVTTSLYFLAYISNLELGGIVC